MIMITVPTVPTHIHTYTHSLLLLSLTHSFTRSFFHSKCLQNEKTWVRWGQSLKMLLTNDLAGPPLTPGTGAVPTIRLFACFETCKLLPYITEDTQFNITGLNAVSIWELVTVEWLAKVKSIIEKSVDSPKSQTKFFSVLDLWRRATAGYLVFRAMGSCRCQDLPRWLTEESAEEILEIERRVAEGLLNANLEAGAKRRVLRRKFWFCDETESVESDLFPVADPAVGKTAAQKVL